MQIFYYVLKYVPILWYVQCCLFVKKIYHKIDNESNTKLFIVEFRTHLCSFVALMQFTLKSVQLLYDSMHFWAYVVLKSTSNIFNSSVLIPGMIFSLISKRKREKQNSPLIYMLCSSTIKHFTSSFFFQIHFFTSEWNELFTRTLMNKWCFVSFEFFFCIWWKPLLLQSMHLNRFKRCFNSFFFLSTNNKTKDMNEFCFWNGSYVC